MKKFIAVLVFMASLFTFPAIALAAKSKITGSDTATSAYSGKKDDDYWTRVWYEKQARKGKHYKKHVYRSGKKKTARKSSKKRSAYRGSGGRVLAKVDLSSQRMNVFQGGKLKYTWKISSGRKGYRTPTGTWKIHRMHKEYYSRKYDNAPMPHAMFYYRGFAIHGTGSISRLGRPASHGCVRLHPDNAAKLFSMVRAHGGTVKVTH